MSEMRFILPLGKFRVVERWDNLAKIAIDGAFSMVIIVPRYGDVREGDILTLYTEILYDKTLQTPVQ